MGYLLGKKEGGKNRGIGRLEVREEEKRDKRELEGSGWDEGEGNRVEHRGDSPLGLYVQCCCLLNR